MFEEMYRNELLNEGRAEGQEEGKDAVIIEMIKSGLESGFINQITHLPIERIERLRKAYT
ncbi:MAG: hypothetical protein LUG24_10090 [Clostridiales bacterium]|nr:hypothetical protein [Clostridiales bacterium]